MPDVIFTAGMFCDEHEFSDNNKITKLSFKVEQFKQWLDQHTNDKGYVNVIVGKSQGGKLYGKLDTWKPSNQESKPNQESFQGDNQNNGGNQQNESRNDQVGYPSMPNDNEQNNNILF